MNLPQQLKHVSLLISSSFIITGKCLQSGKPKRDIFGRNILLSFICAHTMPSSVEIYQQFNSVQSEENDHHKKANFT